MKDKLYTGVVAVGAAIFGVVASVMAVNQITDLTLQQAIDLGKLQLQIESQKNDLETVMGDIKELTEQATGLSNDDDARTRLEQLRMLSDRIESDPDIFLDLTDRVDALTNPDLLNCSNVPITYGNADSCSDHSDWIPRASCPAGKSIRAIGIVAQELAGGGWGCGFEIECCSNVGVLR